MKRIFILLALLAILLTSCRGDPAPLGADAPAGNVPSILGSFALNATDGSGEEYGGTLSIFAGDVPNEFKMQSVI